MKKALPKIPKGRSIFKKLGWFDAIYITIFIAIIFLMVLSNIGIFKYFIAAIIAAFCGFTLIRKDEVSIAHSVWYIIKNSKKRHVFDKNGIEQENTRDLQNIKEIHNGYVQFNSRICAVFIEIPDVNFLLLDDSVQEIMQKALGKAFDKIREYNSISLIKTERKINFKDLNANYNNRINQILNDDKFTGSEKLSRLEILKSKLQQLRKYDGKTTETVYHLIVRGSYEDAMKNAEEILSNFANAGIAVDFATAENIVYALRSQYFLTGDIEVGDKSSSELADYVVADCVKIRNRDIEVNEKTLKILAVTDMPNFVNNAWLATLCNIPEVNITINVGYANKRKTIRKIDGSYYTVGADSERTARLSENVANGAMQSSMESLLEDMTYDRDKLCYTDIYIAFVCDDDGRTERFVLDAINELKMQCSKCVYNQIDAFNNYLVRGIVKPHRDYRQLLTTYLIGKGFPMVFPNLIEADGELIGENTYGIPVAIDFFKRDGKLRVNSNMCVFGKSGGGKSFFLKLYVIQAAARGHSVYIVDPEDEYSTLATAFGAMVIDLNDGKSKINPLHVYSINESGLNSVSSHVEVLETIFKLLFSDLSSELLLQLKNIVLRLYEEKGINDDIDVRSLDATAFPTFSELSHLLEDLIIDECDVGLKADYRKLLLYVKSLTCGQYGKLWDGPSSITANSNFVIFNAQSLLATNNLVLANAQMQLLARFLNVRMINNYQSMKNGGHYGKIILLFDEVHRFLDPRMTVTLDLLNWAAKQCRKYEAALITASQSVIDFAATEELLAKTKALLTESQLNFLFGAKATHVTDIRRIYSEANFTETEIDGIKSANRGEVLAMISDAQRILINIKANETEYRYCVRPADIN